MGVQRWSTWVRVIVAGVLVVGGLAACGDDGADEASTTTTEASSTTPSTEASTTTTTEQVVDVSSGDLPPTQAFVLDRNGVDNTPGLVAFDEAAFGVAPGSVSAAWYQVGEFWAVHFQGLTPEQANGKCLGMMTEATFTPRPYGPGACPDVPADYSLPPGSLRLCGNKAIILTSQFRFRDYPMVGVGVMILQVFDGSSHQSMYGINRHPIDLVPAIDVSNCEVIS